MNKLAVITGATMGIGRALCERFAKAGFDLVVNARGNDDLVNLKKSFEKEFSVKVFTKPTDVSDKQQVLDFAQFVNDLGRPIEVLINNAGYFVPGKIVNEEDGALESMINTNLYSAYHLTRGLVGNMIKKKRGLIINMCSIASFMAYPNGGSYSISKFAMLGFSKVLREELKPYGIRVTSVMPGATLTSSWEGTVLPEERFIRPEDVAETVYSAYAISERSVIEEIIIRPQLGDI